MERLADASNLLTGVRIQDSYTKSQMFMAELDKAVRLNTGSTFAEVARRGDLDVIDGHRCKPGSKHYIKICIL